MFGSVKTAQTRVPVDSKDLEYGSRVIYACLPFSLLFWDQRMVIFQLSGFYCITVASSSSLQALGRTLASAIAWEDSVSSGGNGFMSFKCSTLCNVCV